MRIKSITVSRAAKIKTAQYENTDISVSMAADLDLHDNAETAALDLIGRCDALLRRKVDQVDTGVTAVNSKAGRFGA